MTEKEKQNKTEIYTIHSKKNTSQVLKNEWKNKRKKYGIAINSYKPKWA